MNANAKRFAALLGLAALVSLGTGTGPAALAASPDAVTEVSARDDYFSPANLTVPAGTTVRWVNRGYDAHTSTSDTGVWNSGNLTPGQQFSYTFGTPGTFYYHCVYHRSRGMVGRVTVTGSSIPPGGGTNLALNRPAQASSSLPDHPARLAVDGNAATFWASTVARPGELSSGALPDLGQPGPDAAPAPDLAPDAAADPDLAGADGAMPDAAAELPQAAPASHNYEWILVDLGASRAVQRLHMLWTANYARGYYVYVHLPWACGGWCRAATVGSGDGDDTVTFSQALSVRYFLLQLVYPAVPSGHYELREWEIFGAGTVPQPTPAPSPSVDVAAGKPALASSQQPGYEAGKATDRDRNTEWRTAGGPGWIVVDFGQSYLVNQAVLRWAEGWHASYYALFWWNGTAWQRNFVTTTGNGGDDTVSFAPVRTRYLLAYGFSGPGPGVGLREFEVYTGGTYGASLSAESSGAAPSGAEDIAPADLPQPDALPQQ